MSTPAADPAVTRAAADQATAHSAYRKTLAVTVLVGLLLAALLGFGLLNVRKSEAATRQLVQAHLLAYPDSIGQGRDAVALASFITRDGVAHQGRVLVSVLDNYGDTVPAWVTAGGQATDAPLRLRYIALAQVLALATVIACRARQISRARREFDRARKALRNITWVQAQTAAPTD